MVQILPASSTYTEPENPTNGSWWIPSDPTYIGDTPGAPANPTNGSWWIPSDPAYK
jgi:hypothetical protein